MLTLNLFFDALEKTVDAGANKSVISQLVAYRNNPSNPIFLRALNTHRKLVGYYFEALLPREMVHNAQEVYFALIAYANQFAEPNYKEHVLQKFVIEGNVVGVSVGLDLGVDVNTTVSYVPDMSRSQIWEGFLQLLSFQAPSAWYDGWHRCTPLILASIHGDIKMVKFLVNQGARLDCETKHHNTALDWATKRGHDAVEEFLLLKNAPRNQTSGRDIEAIAGSDLSW